MALGQAFPTYRFRQALRVLPADGILRGFLHVRAVAQICALRRGYGSDRSVAGATWPTPACRTKSNYVTIKELGGMGSSAYTQAAAGCRQC